MIVWSGFGFVTVIFGIVAVGLGIMLGSAGLAEGYGLGLGLLIAAVGNWFAGKALNDPARGREMIDAKSGQRVIFRPNHSLFWIPVQWWSVVLALGGLAVLGAQATGNFNPSPRAAKRASVIELVLPPTSFG